MNFVVLMLNSCFIVYNIKTTKTNILSKKKDKQLIIVKYTNKMMWIFKVEKKYSMISLAFPITMNALLSSYWNR